MGPAGDALSLLERLVSDCLESPGEAWVLNIGTEVVMGTVVNTNGAWLARKLTFLGFSVSRVIAMPDREEDVVEEVRRALERKPRVIVTTGGLGPTYDDSTSVFIARALGVNEGLDSLAYALLLEKYGGDETRITPERRKQAVIPAGSVPIPNPVGTAPGFALCSGESLIVSLPGVPREMTVMFEKYLEPLLARASGVIVHEETLTIIGPREADLAPLVKMLVKAHPDAYIKTHPSIDKHGRSMIRLQVVSRARSGEEARERAFRILGEMKRLMDEAGISWTQS